MQQRIGIERVDHKHRLRQQTVEPVFGIIKGVMGFKQFLLRGLEKIGGEWELVYLAYNCSRHRRRASSTPACPCLGH